jgi:hypothetical protein
LSRERRTTLRRGACRRKLDRIEIRMFCQVGGNVVRLIINRCIFIWKVVVVALMLPPPPHSEFRSLPTFFSVAAYYSTRTMMVLGFWGVCGEFSDAARGNLAPASPASHPRSVSPVPVCPYSNRSAVGQLRDVILLAGAPSLASVRSGCRLVAQSSRMRVPLMFSLRTGRGVPVKMLAHGRAKY